MLNGGDEEIIARRELVEQASARHAGSFLDARGGRRRIPVLGQARDGCGEDALASVPRPLLHGQLH
jgi:hypothetical protein